MEWIPTTGLQKRLPSFRVNVFCRTNYNRRVMSCIDSSGEWDNYNFSYEDEKVIDWIDESESEPLYTEKDMIEFANDIGKEDFHRYKAGIWYTNPFNDRLTYTTEALLETFLKTRIPTKI